MNLGKRVDIAVQVQGGIGDDIVALRFLQELYQICGENIHIDLFGRMGEIQLPPLAYRQSFIGAIYERDLFRMTGGYHVKINIALQVEIIHLDSSYVAAHAPRLIKILKQYQDFAVQHEKYLNTKHGPDYDGAWIDYCDLIGWDRFGCLGAGIIDIDKNAALPIHLHPDAMGILNRLALKNKRYVIIHLGVSMNVQKAADNPKTLLKSRCENLCVFIKENYPKLLTIQLGASNSEPLENVDICLIDRTDLFEAAVLLKHAMILFDGDCGFMHMMHALHGNAIVQWGSTSVKFLGYRESYNIASDFCHPCVWMTNRWTKGCMRGFDEARCLQSIDPQVIYGVLRSFLDNRPEYAFELVRVEMAAPGWPDSGNAVLMDITTICRMPKTPGRETVYGEGRTSLGIPQQGEYPIIAHFVSELPHLNRDIAVLEDGRGALAWYLAEKGHNVTTFDYTFREHPADEATEELAYFAFARKKGFKAAFGSVFNIPTSDNTFHIAIYLSKLAKPFADLTVKELLRVLQPDGVLILSVPWAPAPGVASDSPDLNTYFTEAELRATLADYVVLPPEAFEAARQVFPLAPVPYAARTILFLRKIPVSGSKAAERTEKNNTLRRYFHH